MPPKPQHIPTAACGVPDAILRRKGAKTTSAVPAEVRWLLNSGTIETVNLCEWLIVDHRTLASHVFPSQGWSGLLAGLEFGLSELKAPTAIKRTFAIGTLLANHLRALSAFRKALKTLQAHRSDTVRGWACVLIGRREPATLAERLTWIRPFAADNNAGVREIAWMSVRDSIASQLGEAFPLLSEWVRDPNERIRRFASEATRPRGVWCRHIQSLKEEPAMAMPLLEPLRSDDSKSVRDSVANWLNDAARSQPEFVRTTCRRWLQESNTPETRSLVRRAMRTLTKTDEQRESPETR